MTSGVANKEFSNVHFADRDYNFAYKCWKSNVYFNKEGNRKYDTSPKQIVLSVLKLALGLGYGLIFYTNPMYAKMDFMYVLVGIFSTGTFFIYKFIKKKF